MTRDQIASRAGGWRTASPPPCASSMRARARRVFRPLLVWLSQGFAIAIDAVEWALAPFKGLLSLVIQGLRLIFRRPVETN